MCGGRQANPNIYVNPLGSIAQYMFKRLGKQEREMLRVEQADLHRAFYSIVLTCNKL